MERTISTVPDLVAAFGGTKRLADFLGVVPSAVSNWIAEDYIPRGYHLQLYLEAPRRGIAIDVAMFGLGRPRDSGSGREAIPA